MVRPSHTRYSAPAAVSRIITCGDRATTAATPAATTAVAARCPATAGYAHSNSGAIRGYRAHLDATVLGLTSRPSSSSPCAARGRATVDAFEQAVAAVPDMLQAQRLFGDPDYLLRVVARDLPAFQDVYDERLATLPGVRRHSSTLA